MLARLLDHTLGLDFTLDPSLRCTELPRCTEPVEVQLPPPAVSRLWSAISSGLGHSLGLLAGDY